MTRGVDDAMIRDRIARYVERRLPDAAVVSRTPSRMEAWSTEQPVPWRDAVDADYAPVHPGERWGSPWSTMWLRVGGTAPRPEPGCRIELVVDLGFTDAMPGFQAEGLAYLDGEVVKALNPATRWLPIVAGGYEFHIEAAANPTVMPPGAGGRSFAPTPLGDPRTAGTTPLYTLGEAAVLVIDEEVESLITEMRVLSELAWTLEESSSRRARILTAVSRALDALDTVDLRATAGAARAFLAPELAAPAELGAHEITAVGHAHIDSAWLWPFRETRRKVARTVANVLQLMDEDPALVYAMSSAQQYAWLQEDQPVLFERLRRRVAEGRFVPVGAMWVESDVNMPAGESLVRQLLHGSAYFEQELGVTTGIGWLPDSFGYSGALPQLLRSAGLHGFVTQKMSWNTTNRFPHHTFWWEGIDGSRIATHFPSVDTYNSTLSGAELAHAAHNLTDPALLDASIAPFGFGDGGGGPTREMLDRARRTADLAGSPRVAVARPERFFDALDDVVASGVPLPIWLGEMYLEFHRGVSTSQARTKEVHRRVERLLHEAELWSTVSTVRRGAPYPYEELCDAWRELLLMEFHDVLPGSSIAWVHQEAEARLERVAGRLEALIGSALDVLADGPAAGAELIANAASVPVDGVPAFAIAAARSSPDQVEIEEGPDAFRLRNGSLDVRVERSTGAIVSLIDRATGREAVLPGDRANVPTLHRDAPVRWDAWDVDASIDAAAEPLLDVADLGIDEVDGVAAVTVDRTFGASRLRQRIELRPGEAQLRLDLDVDWQERERMLKLEFPLAVTTDRWQAETQFGHVERPTHRNTSWDEARFEACAHRWVRVAEPGWGVALANLRTYGHDALRTGDGDGASGTRIRASLLRSTRFPDPDADRGSHRFRFALLPAPDVADAVAAGQRLSHPPRVRRGAASRPLVTSSDPGVPISAIKLAEDRSGDLVVRLYESRGARTTTELTIDAPVLSVREVDILERPLVNGPVDLSCLEFLPFRIRTLRITVRRDGD
jgi:alpha-mannosidase